GRPGATAWPKPCAACSTWTSRATAALLRAATRASPLARWQTDHVAVLLGRPVETVVVDTVGDRRQDAPIWEIGGRGVFVKEVQAAVLDGRADFAVHSAKDLPSTATPGLVIVAVPERADARDALVGATLDRLPPGGLVATGSVRRRAQLAAVRPDLTFVGLRGNVDTRLGQAGRYTAIVMAAAALARLQRTPPVVDLLPTAVLLPQVGQGALAVECREDDDAMLAALSGVDHAPSHRALLAERAFLGQLGSGCELPVGALAAAGATGPVRLEGLLASLDGRIVLRAGAEDDDPEVAGRSLAAHLLEDCGGAWLLAGR
ncbi:MAG: hydroxymethylbilane synthase, partial [Acidimicrobiales bacterium]